MRDRHFMFKRLDVSRSEGEHLGVFLLLWIREVAQEFDVTPFDRIGTWKTLIQVL